MGRVGRLCWGEDPERFARETAMAEADCIFCKIVAGEIPCWKLYEDDDVLAFLDVGPISEGHCLVVPKEHYETIDRTPGDVAAACMRVVPGLSRAVMDSTDAEGWNVKQNNGRVAGQSVDHMHIHIIPRRPNDGLSQPWPAGNLDDATAKRLHASITQKLG